MTRAEVGRALGLTRREVAEIELRALVKLRRALAAAGVHLADVRLLFSPALREPARFRGQPRIIGGE